MSASHTKVVVEYPAWVHTLDWAQPYTTDAARIALAVELSRRNVDEQTGGPFGAAIFDEDSGLLLSVGMNLVVPRHNSTLHAEMIAFQVAQARLGSHSLATGGRRAALFTSCEPCAMCFGATLWSGVRRLVAAATADDARAIGFDEGPVFEASWQYLEDRGLRTERGVMRAEAKAVLDGYARRGGLIYNGGTT